MTKVKELLPENTVIVKKPIPMDDSFPEKDYRKYFKYALGKSFTGYMDGGKTTFATWLGSQAGKTLKEAAAEWAAQVEESTRLPEPATMEEMLSRRRFNFLPDANKAFILAFDKAINELGYDFGKAIGDGYGWGLYMIIYGKTGTKSRPVAARIYIEHDGEIELRFHLNNVDKHIKHIENVPAHIKDAFTFTGGDCKRCNTMCAPGKQYTINGNLMQKCNHSTFYFRNPTMEKLPDYMELLAKFFKSKKG